MLNLLMENISRFILAEWQEEYFDLLRSNIVVPLNLDDNQDS